MMFLALACYGESVSARYIQSDPVGLDGGVNTYTYVGGNPLSYIDPEGLSACEVMFADYPIEYADGQTSTLLGGHGGVLGYDSEGSTQYYEYGRYAPTLPGIIGQSLPSDDGNVRRVSMPDLVMDENGNPTPASLAALKEALSKKAGKGTKAKLTCDAQADEKKVYEYVKKIADDRKRQKYSWKPWNRNQCRTFANRAYQAGRSR